MPHFHQLATDRSRLNAATGQARVGRSLRLVHGSPTTLPTPSAAAPVSTDPRRLATGLAQAIAEVVARARHAGQLDGLLTAESSRSLQRAIERARPPSNSPVPRPKVASVRLTTPRAGVIEACAVIDAGIRKRALAFRLEMSAGQWRCTALRVG